MAFQAPNLTLSSVRASQFIVNQSKKHFYCPRNLNSNFSHKASINTNVNMVTTPPSARPNTNTSQQSKPVRRENAARHADVQIYDTTLRDGTQGEGISLSVADKIKVAKALDAFGVSYIEGGWPGANPKDDRFFELCAIDEREGNGFRNSRLVAFGMTRSKRGSCETDPHVQALAAAQTSCVTIVGKASLYHVESVLEITLAENLAMISDTVKYFKALHKEVMLDAEHFFDGYKYHPEAAIRCLRAAVAAGVDVLVLCDTNGGNLPGDIEKITRIVSLEFPDTRIGIHTHNDSDLAVSNSISSVLGGATVVQGTVNGYGERTGNANLISIIPILQLKLGRNCISPSSNDNSTNANNDSRGITGLTGLSRFVEEIANQNHVAGRPFVGISSFAHKGGLHVSALTKLPDSYQHIDPDAVGNQSRILVSELSGRKNIEAKARELGLVSADSDEKMNSVEILREVKKLESKGYVFETAEASVELMIRRSMASYTSPFALLDYTILTGSARTGDGIEGNSQATIKLLLQGDGSVECPSKTILEVAEGFGPVDAFHTALCKTLHTIYPPLADVALVDYKVRILDNENGTAATTRVLIDFKNSSNGKRWTICCANENIITASVNALLDGFEYAMIHVMPMCIL